MTDSDDGSARGEPIAHRRDVRAGRQEHVDLIDASLLAEQPLRGRQIHHREVAREDGGEPLGTQQAAHAEALESLRRRELDVVVDA